MKNMKEKIVKFKRGPFPKKYTAYIKNNQTKKVRKIHFGDKRYQQYIETLCKKKSWYKTTYGKLFQPTFWYKKSKKSNRKRNK
jgi:hypothetical protein